MGRKEDNINRARDVMHTPEFIRNIGTAAHIDHGKCVSADARVSLANGEHVPAEALFERLQAEGALVRDDEEEQVYELAEPVGVNAFDTDSGLVKEGRLTHVWKLAKDEPLVEVTLANGRSIQTTPEHKFLVLSPEAAIEKKQARDLDEGDHIVAARNLVHDGRTSNELRRAIFQALAEDYGFYLRVEDELAATIREHADGRIEALHAEIGCELEPDSLYHCVRDARFRLRDFVRLCDRFDIDLADAWDAVLGINYRGTRSRGEKSSHWLDLRGSVPDVFYLAGLFLGDGDLEKTITNNDAAIHERLEQAAERLGVPCHIREYDATRIEIGGLTFKRVLERLFDYPTEDKSYSIRVSAFVQRAPLSLVAGFLRGYFDADGTVETGRRAVTATSMSEAFLEELQLLLYKFDVASKHNRAKNTLVISGKSSLEHFREIGFTVPRKQDAFEKLLSTAGISQHEYVPIDGAVLATLREKHELPQSVFGNGYGNYETNEIGLSKDSLERILEEYPDEEAQELRRLLVHDTTFPKVTGIQRRDEADWVYDFTVEGYQNFVAEGMVIHNTTFSDNLIAGAGMMSEELAGEQLVLDFDEQEQERGITINAAALSMVHEFEDDDYLINLFDTPGHVDFGGDVTRAMRAIDGAIILVDAVESVMPQTETVIRQALREKVKPILFINKVDRLINEVKIGPQEMQQKFASIIREVNELIRKFAPNDEIAENWQVTAEDGTVAFGSALYNWAVSVPWMQKTGFTMEHVYNRLNDEEVRELIQECPLSDVMLNLVIRHMPPPDDAQAYRIPHIWRGDVETEYGKSLVNCDEDGPLSFMVTKIIMDEHAGEVAVGRMFSGKITRGQEVYISGVAGEHRTQGVSMMVGADRVTVDEVDAGNLAAVTGLKDAIAGSTVTDVEDVEPFERIVHVSEPVVTVSVEAKHVAELPQLVKALRSVSKADPSIVVDINPETGENLMSGMGELHLEVTERRLEEEHGVDVITSEPIVVYRESVQEESEEFEGRSPNRHNRLFFEVEPLDHETVEALREGKLPEGKVRSQDEKEVREELMELGWERDEARNVSWVHGTNLFVDDTKGVQYLYETMELVHEGFTEVMEGGPLADEPVMGLKVRLLDAKLHEDAIHRGPAQTIPAVRNAIYGAMLTADPTLLEPRQRIFVSIPQDLMGDVTRELQQRRATIDDIESEGEQAVVHAEAPVAEMFGFSAAIRSATGGRALWSTEQSGFHAVPQNLKREIIAEIRDRKGMKKEIPGPAYYAE